MGRDPRHFRPWTLIEVTCVIIQNRYLLRPSAQLNDLFVGVLGRAQWKHEVLSPLPEELGGCGYREPLTSGDASSLGARPG